MAHTGGSDRRLSQTQGSEGGTAEMAAHLVSILAPLTDSMSVKQDLSRMIAGKAAAPLLADMSWPAGSVPALLASRDNRVVAALATDRRGVVVQMPDSGAGRAISTHFELTGINHLGTLVGASWSPSGLMLSTTTGAIAECAGLPTSGSWPCHQVGPALPNGGSSILAATTARVPGTGLIRAAVAFADDAAVTLFQAAEDSGVWMPAGEVQLHRTDVPAGIHLSFAQGADELLISSQDGSTFTWRFGEAEPAFAATPLPSGITWHVACGMGGDHIAHLATRGTSNGHQLLLSSKI